MEAGMISLGRMEAHMVRRLLPADQKCVAYRRQRIPIDSADVECRWRSAVAVGASFLTSDFTSVHDGLSRRGFRWQNNRDYL
jgi:6-phosphogluconate dehydrogenase (decarboxylating)